MYSENGVSQGAAPGVGIAHSGYNGCLWEATVGMWVEGEVNVRNLVLDCCPISPS